MGSQFSAEQTGAASARTQAEAHLRQAIAARTAKVGVAGLGKRGSAALRALAEVGFSAVGTDRSAEVAAKWAGGAVSVGTDDAALADCDVVLIAVPAVVRSDWSVDLVPLRRVAAALRAAGDRPRLVLVESTLPPGTTRALATDLLGVGPDSAVFVAHTPDRLQAGNTSWNLTNTPIVVGGVDAGSGRLAEALWSTVCAQVVTVSSPEVAEVTKLVENAFTAVNISFIGEITRLSHALGISADEVTRAAATKPYGYLPFYPGAGIGGYCIPNDFQILRRAIRDANLNTPLLSGTAEAASDLPKAVVDHLADLVEGRGGTLEGERVLLVGVGFKVGSSDTTDTPARDVVRTLRQRGAVPVYVDAGVPSFTVDGEPVPRIDGGTLGPGAYSAGIVLSGDATVPGRQLLAAARVLLDAGGGRVSPGGIEGAARL